MPSRSTAQRSLGRSADGSVSPMRLTSGANTKILEDGLREPVDHEMGPPLSESPARLLHTKADQHDCAEAQPPPLNLSVTSTVEYPNWEAPAAAAGPRPLSTHSEAMLIPSDANEIAHGSASVGDATPAISEHVSAEVAQSLQKEASQSSTSSESSVEAEEGIEREDEIRLRVQTTHIAAAAEQDDMDDMDEGAEESYVDLDVSRNDPHLAGLHSMVSAQPGSSSFADARNYFPENADAQVPGDPEEEESQQDVNKLLADIKTESSMATSDDEPPADDDALLAGLGFTDGNDDEGDWV